MSIALRLFWRDWRGGELGVLLVAVVLAVSIVTTLGLFVDRLERAMGQRAAMFMAGDLVLRSSRPIPPAWLEDASQRGLRQALIVRFATMVFAGEKMQLATVKAVSDEYPLLGRVGVNRTAGGDLSEYDHGPPAGEVWVDARLLPALDLAIGDRIGLGLTELRVGAILQSEPDGSSSLVAMGPRLMMNTADVEAAGVLQPGSRVQYLSLLAGDAAALEQWRAGIEPRLDSGQRFLSVDDGQPRVANALDRAQSFLLLGGSLGVVLAGVALAMAARRYGERHADYVAIMKTLGLGASAIRRLYFGNLMLLGAIGIALGWLLAWLLQEAAFALLSGLITGDVPAAGFDPLLLGAGTGLVCLGGFALPSLFQMASASPLRVLRRDIEVSGGTRWLYASGFCAFVVLLYWYSGDLRLTLLVLGCVVVTGSLAGSFAYWLLRRARLPGLQARSALRLALAGLQRHAILNALQILIFALTLMLLMVMLLVRTSLIADWQRQLPARAPNHFLVNIAPYQVEGVERFLAEQGLEHAGLYPMVPGRVMAINGEPVRAAEVEDVNLDREFNLSWSDALPTDNSVVSGRWWGTEPAEEVSAEEGLARALGLGVGDRLSVQIGSERFETRLTSIRRLNWDSMRPNFYLMFPRHVLERYPGTWLTSFYLPGDRKGVLNDFVRSFPTVSVLEMDALLHQLRGITDQLAMAVELVLLLLLVSGSLVMIASVQSGLDERFQESAILRTLGAGRRLVLGSLAAEFALLGLLAGLLATAGAELAAWFVQTQLLDMSFRWHPVVWVAGPLAGTALAALLGLATCRRVVDTPPAIVLRELA